MYQILHIRLVSLVPNNKSKIKLHFVIKCALIKLEIMTD